MSDDSQPHVELTALPKFPAKVEATAGVKVTRENGVYTFTLDLSSVGPVATLQAGDYFLVLRADGSFAKISFANLAAAIEAENS